MFLIIRYLFVEEQKAGTITFHESEEAVARSVAYALAQQKDKFELVTLQKDHKIIYDPN